MKVLSFKVVTVYYDSRRGWLIKGADGKAVSAKHRARHAELFEVAEAARVASGADIAELMVNGELRLAWRGPDMYQWLHDGPSINGAWLAPGGDA